jgi:hypothetical protein
LPSDVDAVATLPGWAAALPPLADDFVVPDAVSPDDEPQAASRSSPAAPTATSAVPLARFAVVVPDVFVLRVAVVM